MPQPSEHVSFNQPEGRSMPTRPLDRSATGELGEQQVAECRFVRVGGRRSGIRSPGQAIGLSYSIRQTEGRVAELPPGICLTHRWARLRALPHEIDRVARWARSSCCS